MKPVFFLFILLALVLSFFHFGAYQHTIPGGGQTTYSYRAESIAYSDIQRLYTADTSGIKKTFFQSASLRYAEATISCGITKTILRESDHATVAVFQLQDVEVMIRNDEVSAKSYALRDQVMHPVFALIDSNGKIVSVSTDTSISQSASVMVKEIISRLQFVMPERRLKQWQTEESNSLGTFLATYLLLAKRDTLYEYEKINKGYLAGEKKHRHQRLVPDGKSVIYTDSSRHIRQANVSETLTTLYGTDTASVSGNKISIAVIGESKASTGLLSDLRQLYTSALYAKTSTLVSVLKDEEIRELTYRNTLGQDDLISLMQQLSGAINPDAAKKEGLVTKFRSLAALSPADCKNIGLTLVKAPYASLQYEILSHALSRARTAAATDVLSQLILSRRTEEEIAMDLLPVLATTAVPTDNAVATCRSLGFELNTSPAIATTAQLALGGIANNFRKTDPRKSENICAFLFEKLPQQGDTLQQLLVLGNTGSASVIPLVKLYLGKPGVSGNVRVAAVRAMRLIEQDEATKMLTEIIARKERTLMEAAKETLAFRQEVSNNK